MAISDVLRDFVEDNLPAGRNGTEFVLMLPTIHHSSLLAELRPPLDPNDDPNILTATGGFYMIVYGTTVALDEKAAQPWLADKQQILQRDGLRLHVPLFAAL